MSYAGEYEPPNTGEEPQPASCDEPLTPYSTNRGEFLLLLPIDIFNPFPSEFPSFSLFLLYLDFPLS
jgi:hypothetical protein